MFCRGLHGIWVCWRSWRRNYNSRRLRVVATGRVATFLLGGEQRCRLPCASCCLWGSSQVCKLPCARGGAWQQPILQAPLCKGRCREATEGLYLSVQHKQLRCRRRRLTRRQCGWASQPIERNCVSLGFLSAPLGPEGRSGGTPHRSPRDPPLDFPPPPFPRRGHPGPPDPARDLFLLGGLKALLYYTCHRQASREACRRPAVLAAIPNT